MMPTGRAWASVGEREEKGERVRPGQARLARAGGREGGREGLGYYCEPKGGRGENEPVKLFSFSIS